MAFHLFILYGLLINFFETDVIRIRQLTDNHSGCYFAKHAHFT